MTDPTHSLTDTGVRTAMVGRPKLPVHLLFDIDGTLLRIVGRGQVSRGRAMAFQPHRSDVTFSRYRDLGPLAPQVHMLSYSSTDTPEEVQHRAVVLRPHAVSLLHAIAVDRVLDTATVAVNVSLYTRQNASYCRAVASVLLRGGAGAATPFHCLMGGESCLTTEDPHQQDEPPDSNSGDGSAFCWQAAGGANEWRKSVGASGAPFSTLLVDDKAENFIPRECAAGRCVLVPSFDLGDADSGMDDAVFTAEESTDNCLLDRLVVAPTAHGPRLLPLLRAFVRACDAAHGELLEANSRFTAVPTDQRRRAYESSARTVNFLTDPRAAQFQEEWNSFHADCDAEMAPFFLHGAASQQPAQGSSLF